MEELRARQRKEEEERQARMREEHRRKESEREERTRKHDEERRKMLEQLKKQKKDGGHDIPIHLVQRDYTSADNTQTSITDIPVTESHTPSAFSKPSALIAPTTPSGLVTTGHKKEQGLQCGKGTPDRSRPSETKGRPSALKEEILRMKRESRMAEAGGKKSLADFSEGDVLITKANVEQCVATLANSLLEKHSGKSKQESQLQEDMVHMVNELKNVRLITDQ
jgi:hypothetical protein